MIHQALITLVSTVPSSRATSTRSVQRCSVLLQSEATTRWPKRIFLSMPSAAAHSSRYVLMSGPAAMLESCGQGRHEKPNRPMELSVRMPGYFQKAHVPPISWRDSRMA